MKNLKTLTRLFVGGKWLPEGSTLPGDLPGFDYEKAASKGMIEDAEGAEIVNPAAAALAIPAPAPDGDVARLLSLLDVDTADEFEEQVTALQAAANKSAEYARDLDESARKVASLEAQLATLGTVHAIEGEALPTNFNRRSQLDALGLTTWESLRGKTARQLSAIEGITDEQAGQIVTKVDAHFAPAE